MEDKIKQLIETYQKDRRFYSEAEDYKRASVYKWVIADLQKLLEANDADNE